MMGFVLVALGTWTTLVVAAGDAGAPPASPGAGASPASPLLGPLSSATGSASPSLKEYRLRRADDGTGDLVYEGDGFTARVARDGSVRFRDRHLAIAVLPLLLGIRGGQAPQPAVPSLQEMFRHLKGPPPARPSEEDIEASTTRYGSRLPIPEVTPFRPDPREACPYPSPCFSHAATVLVTVNVAFDLTDELMRLSGQDPYRFAKARFLAGTRELRAELGARAHANDLRRSMLELPKRLEAIACDPSRSPPERSALLRALRVEVDGTTPEGRAAAEIIDRHLAGTTDGGPACP